MINTSYKNLIPTLAQSVDSCSKFGARLNKINPLKFISNSLTANLSSTINFKKVSFCVLSAGLLLSCGKNILNPEQAKSLSDSLTIPNDWEVVHNQYGFELIAISPKHSLGDIFRDNINILARDLDSPTTLDEFFLEANREVSKQIDNFQLLDEGCSYLSEQPSAWHDFSTKINETTVKVRQHFLLTDNSKKAHIVTAAAVADNFDKINKLIS